MKKLSLCCCLFLLAAGWLLRGAESYSGLMDRAEKLTSKRYDPKSRAFKIKSRELDDILDSPEPQEKKIRRLKEYIRDLEESDDSGDSTQGGKTNDPLRNLRKAAEKGDPEALYQLGMIYWEGRQQLRSLPRALNCFRQAAAAKHRKSEFMLALADWKGKGVIADPARAFSRFAELYRNGFRAAGIPLGIMCYEGTGTAKNYGAAEKYLLAGLPEQKNIPGQYYPEAVLGRIYYTGGNGVKADPVKAAGYLKASGDPESLYLLGFLYRGGKGIAKDDAAAAKCFRSAAGKGHRGAGFELGRMYRLGQGVGKNDALAVQYLTPAADQGSPHGEAAFMLGKIYADPKSPVRNDRNAFHYFCLAARRDNAEALYRCGFMLRNGIGTEKDPAAALGYLKAAAKAGHSEAAWLCGELEFESGQVKESIPYYRQAADSDHAGAIRKFAGFALNGKGMKADPELAIRYLKKLGRRAEVSDLELLASLYESGIGPVKAQLDEAIRYYTAAAGLGSVKSQVRLAQIFHSLGRSEQALHYAELAAKAKNPEAVRLLVELRSKTPSSSDKQAESLRYLRDLADRGDRGAMRQLGILLYGKSDYAGAEKYLKVFENGSDPEILFILGQAAYRKEDFKRAFGLLRQAADAGYTRALVMLGNMYHRGAGVHQDFRRALICYRQAAAKNDAEGMFLTGMMYYNAEGVSSDYSEALRWFLAAADRGNVLAMQYLSIMYKEGIGVPKNNQEAMKWRRKSAGSRP